MKLTPFSLPRYLNTYDHGKADAAGAAPSSDAENPQANLLLGDASLGVMPLSAVAPEESGFDLEPSSGDLYDLGSTPRILNRGGRKLKQVKVEYGGTVSRTLIAVKNIFRASTVLYMTAITCRRTYIKSCFDCAI